MRLPAEEIGEEPLENGGVVTVKKRSRLDIDRHYKKDSRFIDDLYTLCYDEGQSIDSVLPKVKMR